MGWWKDMWSGTPEQHKRVSTLRRSQEPIYKQLTQAAQRQGAGGAFGDAADYYRNLLSDDSEDFQAFAAPEMRRYNEQIIPDLAEQFAGMGAGGLSSSGFRNAAIGKGVDLSERLGALRANLRASGAQGLRDIGQQSLGNYSQDVMTQQGTEGLGSQLPSMLVNAGLNYATGGASGIMQQGMNAWGGQKVGAQTSPYGGGGQPGSFKLPSFNPRLR